jgi:predicted AAA+ superfamily ATPase
LVLFIIQYPIYRNPCHQEVRLFQLDDSPSLILIDEIADYLAKASAEDAGSDSTLGEQTTTFFSALFDAVTEVDDVTVIYSIADTTFTERAEAIEEETKIRVEKTLREGLKLF